MSAQGRTSAIAGVVRDAAGGILSGARLTLRNSSTGVARELRSDGAGRWRAAFVEPGDYEVQASYPDFTTAERLVTLRLDEEAEVNFTLEVAGVRGAVTVASESRPLDASAPLAASVTGAREIVALPLNGRDWVQLATLAPDVKVARAQVRNDNTGQGVQFSVGGARPAQNNFRLDGVSITDFTGSTPGSILGVNLGVDAVAEFSLIESAYDAQYGRAAGGIVNAVTRSGSNEFHGAASYWMRNDALDARNFFDAATSPEFRRNQFAASVGGPIARGSTFFFLDYEGIRLVQGSTTIDTTLSDSARTGLLTTGQVTVDPAMASLVALYPRPNGSILGDTGIYRFVDPQQGAEHFGTARLDRVLGKRDSAFARYTIDDGSLAHDSDFRIDRVRSSTRNQSLAADETHVFSPALLNSARVGFARSFSAANATEALIAGADDPALSFLPDHKELGGVIAPGLTEFPGGTGSIDADRDALNSLQIRDDAAWSRGAHWLTFGVSVERTSFSLHSQTVGSGEFTFASLADLLTNRPSNFRAQLAGSDPDRLFRQWIPAWYLQDRWRIAPRLTVSLGLRHEWATVPDEADGKVSNLDTLTSSSMRVGGSLFDNPSFRNFAPRAGLAWDVTGHGTTVVRAGYGIAYDLLLSQFLLLAGVRNAPFFLLGDVSQPGTGAFPKAAYTALEAGAKKELRVERLPRDMHQPYLQHWNLSVERALVPGTLLRVAYTGAHGVHLSDTVEDANLVQPEILPGGQLYFPAGGQKLNPNFGMIRNRLFDGQSFYQALSTTFERRWSHGLQFRASYTFGKSIDDDSDTFATTESPNAIGIPVDGNSKFNRGLSNFDIRRYFVASGFWTIPSPTAASWRRVFGGWQLAALATASTGLPFTATLSYDAARTGTARPDRRGGQRPDLAPGWSNDPVTGNPNQWFDPAAFQRPAPGFLGNLGRNTLTGPALAAADLALSKESRFGGRDGRVRLAIRAEAFNALNHVNFDLPAPSRMQVFSRTSTPEDIGRITSAQPSRQLQLGLKLNF